MDGIATPRLVLNDVIVNFSAGTLRTAKGLDVPLRAQSFAVLRELVRHRGDVVEKDALIDAVWKGVAVTDDSLVQCISEIRRALGDTDRSLLKTVPRRGYRLDLSEDVRLDALRPQPARGLLVLGLLALLLIVALWHRPGQVLPGPPRIAVLPFANLGPDPALDPVGRGVAEDIVSILAKSPDVTVIARNSSFRYGAEPVDVRRIGRELGADFVLDGSVRRSGDGLRIVAQLSDVATGQSLWSERFDRSGPDAVAPQDEVTAQIISSLTGEENAMKRVLYRQAWESAPSRLGEYGYYLRGLDLFSGANSPEDNDRAGRIWAQGLGHYPDSALLKVKLGWYHWAAHWTYRSAQGAAHIAEAERLANQVTGSKDLTPEIRRQLHWLNAFLRTQRRDFDGAVAEARMAVELSPFDARMLSSLAEVLICAGDYRNALGWIDQAVAWEPDLKPAAHASRGNAYRLMGRDAQAVIEFQQVPDLSPRMNLSAAISLMQLGRPAEAREWTAKAARHRPMMTQDGWRDTSCHRNPVIVAAELAALSRAGLPR
ncbi:winged helix-turn-helix domain-containing protein [Paracoccus sp. PAR01]|uniref:winged helix-turn-helix domain-containing protein n=1 Tax=Paracoccus sp. PAR01 TaxID=2769282 RepID=UPI001783404C|nr:winged helix-turn-helix domain-containing protein [Paracoccus sp. PAR01]MBD9527386.1 winged helix-turn-helix domain-containing protein [Paracoccus sp. PAR01]